MKCVAVCPQKARKADSEKVAGLAARLKEICSVRKGREYPKVCVNLQTDVR